MKMRLKGILLTACACTATCIAAIVVPTNVFSQGNADNVVHNYIDKDFAPTTSGEYITTEYTKEKNQFEHFTFCNYKRYNSEAQGLCRLNTGGYIQKVEACKGLSGLQVYIAEADAGEKVNFITSFDDDFDDDDNYTYEYTLSTSPTICSVVGNYFKVIATSEIQISSIHMYYDCYNEVDASATVTLDDTDYAEIVEENSKSYLVLHGTVTSGTLTKDALSVRNSDNDNEYAITCSELTLNGTDFDAKFSLSDLNSNTGRWAQYLYKAYLYIDGVRYNQTGRITGTSLTTQKYTNIGRTSIYQVSQDSDGLVITWSNKTVGKGLLLELTEGTHYTDINEFDCSSWSEDSNTWVSFYIQGWVETEDEAKYIVSNASKYTIVNRTDAVSTKHSYVFPAVANKFRYSSASKGGYKVVLCFNVASLNSYGEDQLICAMLFNGVEYKIQDSATNDGLLKISYCVSKGSGKTVCSCTNNNYNYKFENFWNWLALYGTNA